LTGRAKLRPEGRHAEDLGALISGPCLHVRLESANLEVRITPVRRVSVCGTDCDIYMYNVCVCIYVRI